MICKINVLIHLCITIMYYQPQYRLKSVKQSLNVLDWLKDLFHLAMNGPKDVERRLNRLTPMFMGMAEQIHSFFFAIGA